MTKIESVDAASYRGRSVRAARERGLLGRLASLLSASAFVLVSVACQTVPITGRTAFNAFSEQDDIQLGREAYGQILAEAKLVERGKDLEMVQRVMDRLVKVADDPGYEWEVRLIDDPKTVNAFALPGGKMAVYTGILPVCATEEGLAVVMGHEIGHVVARHGTERMSINYGAEMLLSMLDLGELAQLGSLAIQTLATPYSREHESESDRIGQIYMARAGYDPEESIRFWERMNAATGGGGPTDGVIAYFTSTHPSHEKRVKDLEKWLPEARKELR